MKFVKRPIVIEAVQWNGKNDNEILRFIGGDGGRHVTVNGKTFLEIDTLEGAHFADLKDWIIKGIKGEFYPCKPDIFEATYDRVRADGKEE